MIDGRPSLRTVAGDLEQARVERELLREAARNGLLTLWPRLTFGAVASQWLARFERRVATGERRERTLENYRYYLDQHLVPQLGRKRIRSLTPGDMASLVATLTEKGLAPKTVANALVPLGGILRFARRRGYILDDPLRRLEKAERPRPTSPRATRPRPERDRRTSPCPPALPAPAGDRSLHRDAPLRTARPHLGRG
jgi:hypothetical protein